MATPNTPMDAWEGRSPKDRELIAQSIEADFGRYHNRWHSIADMRAEVLGPRTPEELEQMRQLDPDAKRTEKPFMTARLKGEPDEPVIPEPDEPGANASPEIDREQAGGVTDFDVFTAAAGGAPASVIKQAADDERREAHAHLHDDPRDPETFADDDERKPRSEKERKAATEKAEKQKAASSDARAAAERNAQPGTADTVRANPTSANESAVQGRMNDASQGRPQVESQTGTTHPGESPHPL